MELKSILKINIAELGIDLNSNKMSDIKKLLQKITNPYTMISNTYVRKPGDPFRHLSDPYTNDKSLLISELYQWVLDNTKNSDTDIKQISDLLNELYFKKYQQIFELNFPQYKDTKFYPLIRARPIKLIMLLETYGLNQEDLINLAEIIITHYNVHTDKLIELCEVLIHMSDESEKTSTDKKNRALNLMLLLIAFHESRKLLRAYHGYYYNTEINFGDSYLYHLSYDNLVEIFKILNKNSKLDDQELMCKMRTRALEMKFGNDIPGYLTIEKDSRIDNLASISLQDIEQIRKIFESRFASLTPKQKYEYFAAFFRLVEHEKFKELVDLTNHLEDESCLQLLTILADAHSQQDIDLLLDAIKRESDRIAKKQRPVFIFPICSISKLKEFIKLLDEFHKADLDNDCLLEDFIYAKKNVIETLKVIIYIRKVIPDYLSENHPRLLRTDPNYPLKFQAAMCALTQNMPNLLQTQEKGRFIEIVAGHQQEYYSKVCMSVCLFDKLGLFQCEDETSQGAIKQLASDPFFSCNIDSLPPDKLDRPTILFLASLRNHELLNRVIPYLPPLTSETMNILHEADTDITDGHPILERSYDLVVLLNVSNILTLENYRIARDAVRKLQECGSSDRTRNQLNYCSIVTLILTKIPRQDPTLFKIVIDCCMARGLDQVFPGNFRSGQASQRTSNFFKPSNNIAIELDDSFLLNIIHDLLEHPPSESNPQRTNR